MHKQLTCLFHSTLQGHLFTLGLGDTLGRQVTSAEDSTRKTKQFKEPVGEIFNFSGHKWEDITVVVIAHNQHWTDAKRKSKENFWMVQI